MKWAAHPCIHDCTMWADGSISSIIHAQLGHRPPVVSPFDTLGDGDSGTKRTAGQQRNERYLFTTISVNWHHAFRERFWVPHSTKRWIARAKFPAFLIAALFP
jgi:hypothetical protein